MKRERWSYTLQDLYNDVILLDGWLFEFEEKDDNSKLYTWKERSSDNVKADHKDFAKKLLLSVEARVKCISQGKHLNVLKIFDSSFLVALHCGKSNNCNIDAGECDEYGVEVCKKVLVVLRVHSNTNNCEIDFDQRLAHRYMLDLKDAVGVSIFMDYCNSWFHDRKCDR